MSRNRCEDHRSRHSKSVFHIILSLAFSLTLFIALVLFLNFLRNYVHSSIYDDSVSFLNQNVLLVVILSIVYGVGEIFGALGFPLNLPAPIFNAVASVLLLSFLLNLLKFIAKLTGETVFNILIENQNILSLIVFLLVLAGGYILIFMRLLLPKS